MKIAPKPPQTRDTDTDSVGTAFALDVYRRNIQKSAVSQKMRITAYDKVFIRKSGGYNMHSLPEFLALPEATRTKLVAARKSHSGP